MLIRYLKRRRELSPYNDGRRVLWLCFSCIRDAPGNVYIHNLGFSNQNYSADIFVVFMAPRLIDLVVCVVYLRSATRIFDIRRHSVCINSGN